MISTKRFSLALLFGLLVLAVDRCAAGEEIKEATKEGDESQWDKIGAKLSEFWDKTKDAVSEGAKVVGVHAEKFGKDAKEAAEKLFRNAKTEVGITPDSEKKEEVSSA